MATWDKTFWKATAERAIATAAQAVGGVVVIDAMADFSIDWVRAATFVGVTAFLSVVKSVGVNAATNNGPGVGNAETLKEN
jgi:hypothetical protein